METVEKVETGTRVRMPDGRWGTVFGIAPPPPGWDASRLVVSVMLDQTATVPPKA